jgi:ABC-type antimicrobial peptide transport system permease subunit
MSKLDNTLRLAVFALRRNGLRSVLATLGISIGVAAVIAMVEVGKGSAAAVEQSIASMGANNLLVQPAAANIGGISLGSGSLVTLTHQDAERILKECPGTVSAVAPVVRTRTQVVYGNRNWVPLYIYGTTPSFLEVREWELAKGEPFTQRDVLGATKVCLLGQTLARELFQGEVPVGKEVRVQNVSFRVVGVLNRKGANMAGLDQDDMLLAPWTTIKYRVAGVSAANANQGAAAGPNAPGTVNDTINSLDQRYPNANPMALRYPQPSLSELANTPQPVRFTNVDQILIRAASVKDIKPAMAQIKGLLRERHRLRPGQPDDFKVLDMTELGKAQAATSHLMRALLLVVALISLMVGGVGIMNIMLVSVTERTREIGLRMAVGARARDILRQFLVEAVVLCLLGGALGIAVGRGVSYLLPLLAQWPTEPSRLAVVAAVAVSATVGVVFGFYPALKASRLDPIAALRYE